MKLGITVNVSLGIADLEESLAFFQKMGFRLLERNLEPYPWAVLYDGQVQIGLHQDGMIYSGLTYFAPDMDERIARLEQTGVEFSLRNEVKGRVFQAIFLGADDLGINLVRYEDAAPLPTPTANERLGIFGEYSLGVDDLDFSAAYWQEFGFALNHRAEEPYPWAILSDGLLTLGLHETQEFDGPTLTYFAPDMKKRVEQLAAAGVPVKDTPMGGTTVFAPDGQQFFLFTGEL